MEGSFTLNELANLIILISAVIIAVKNIYAFFKKPVDNLQEKAKKEEEKHIEEVFDKKMPDLLAKHSEKV